MAYQYPGKCLYSLQVVGESFHNKEIKKVISLHPNLQAMAIVKKELLNEHDDKAVVVLIDGLQVGHLSRGDARTFHNFLSSQSLNEYSEFYVPAKINISKIDKNNPGISLDFADVLDKAYWNELFSNCSNITLPKIITHKSTGCLGALVLFLIRQ